MKKIKVFIQKHRTKFIILVCILFGGIIGVSADEIATIFTSEEVSFDNTTEGASGMESTNVQAAIEELYDKAKNASSAVKVGKMSINLNNGSDLYADTTESGRYIYRGANPNNYICLASGTGSCSSDDLYRIISVESNGELKVIKNASVGKLQYEPAYFQAIDGIKDKNSTAGTRYSSSSTDYCYVSSASSYYGCPVWGSKNTIYDSTGISKATVMPHEVGGGTYELPEYDSYLTVYLNGGTYPTKNGTTNITSWLSSQNSVIQSNIVKNHWFNVGVVSSEYKYTLAQNKEQEASYKWKGDVGLMNPTDYVSASSNSYCKSVYNYYSTYDCYYYNNAHNWLFYAREEWFMNIYSRNELNALKISDGAPRTQNERNISYSHSHMTYDVRPVFYLSPNIALTGSGTNDENVYRIS